MRVAPGAPACRHRAAALQPLRRRRALHRARAAGAGARRRGTDADRAQRRGLGRAAASSRWIRSTSAIPGATRRSRAPRARAWEAGGFDLVQSHERIAGCDIYRAGDGVHARVARDPARRGRAAASASASRSIPTIATSAPPSGACSSIRALRAVICNSAMVRDEIERRFRVAPEKLHVIYNGVDLEHFHPRQRAALRAAARAELGVGERRLPVPVRRLRILAQGTGCRDRRARALRRRGASAWRWPGATGTRRASPRRRAPRASATACGLLGGREDVRPLYAAADCFILPTRYDPFPEHRAGSAGDGPAGDRRPAQRRRRNPAARAKAAGSASPATSPGWRG